MIEIIQITNSVDLFEEIIKMVATQFKINQSNTYSEFTMTCFLYNKEPMALAKNMDLYFKVRFVQNRLALITCYLLDIDLALFSLLMLWSVKSNKSWHIFLQQKSYFIYMVSSNLLILFNINFMKSWIYSNLMASWILLK